MEERRCYFSYPKIFLCFAKERQCRVMYEDNGRPLGFSRRWKTCNFGKLSKHHRCHDDTQVIITYPPVK